MGCAWLGGLDRRLLSIYGTGCEFDRDAGLHADENGDNDTNGDVDRDGDTHRHADTASYVDANPDPNRSAGVNAHCHRDINARTNYNTTVHSLPAIGLA